MGKYFTKKTGRHIEKHVAPLYQIFNDEAVVIEGGHTHFASQQDESFLLCRMVVNRTTEPGSMEFRKRLHFSSRLWWKFRFMRKRGEALVWEHKSSNSLLLTILLSAPPKLQKLLIIPDIILLQIHIARQYHANRARGKVLQVTPHTRLHVEALVGAIEEERAFAFTVI